MHVTEGELSELKTPPSLLKKKFYLKGADPACINCFRVYTDPVYSYLKRNITPVINRPWSKATYTNGRK